MVLDGENNHLYITYTNNSIILNITYFYQIEILYWKSELEKKLILT